MGWLMRISPSQVLPLCSRTGDIVEPRLCPQWYLDCSAMAQVGAAIVQPVPHPPSLLSSHSLGELQRSLDAVSSGELVIRPAMFEQSWFVSCRQFLKPDRCSSSCCPTPFSGATGLGTSSRGACLVSCGGGIASRRTVSSSPLRTPPTRPRPLPPSMTTSELICTSHR